MSEFEEYLKKNRHQLKVEVTSKKAFWDIIETELEQKKTKHSISYWGIAASLALLLSSIALIRTFQTSTVSPSYDLPLYSFSMEYGKVEQEYKKEISYQMKLVDQQSINTVQDMHIESFLMGLEVLENVYEDYKRIIEQQGCNELMMKLVIKNYKRRLEILESLNTELKNRAQSHLNTKNSTHETIEL